MGKRFASFNISIFLVEMIFALEVTACIVIAPSAAKALKLDPSHSGWIVNSYLYTAFASMIAFLVFQKNIVRLISAASCFYTGIWIFVIGNIMCWQAATAELFFAGRIIQGFGGACAMTGELWATSQYYRERITIPLFWAECGSAIGIIAGPAMGGFIASTGSEQWRLVFLINAVTGAVTAVTAWIALRDEKRPDFQALKEKFCITGWFLWLVLIQGAVAALAVGAEFLMSDYMQVRLHKSPSVVGFMAVIASAGTILGSWWMAWFNRSFTRCARNALVMMFAMHVMVVYLFVSDHVIASAAPIFVIGICMGIANVAIYAEISRKVGPEHFLPATLIYLIAMQAGNAIGVQTTSLTEGNSWPLMYAEFVMVLVPMLPLAAMMIWRGLRRTSPPGDPA